MPSTDRYSTQSLQEVAIFATAAIEQGRGEKFAVVLVRVGTKSDNMPLYEFRAELPGLPDLVNAVAHQKVKVVPQTFSAIVRGLKRAGDDRAYSASDLLRLGGA